ncbi:MAG: helix-turn-helix transcriptional regulator, partial [Chloroflexota bacterium]|nr:helix-turn-helix transcriptional regulator [Chloroflexota bacterium]
MEPQIRYCTTSDGASIAYATMGDGPMVIMPPSVFSCFGLLRVHPGYRTLCDAIAAELTIVLYDGRGMG